MENHTPEVHISKTPTARVVEQEPGVWHLEIPPSQQGGYRLAQLDDHGASKRGRSRWMPPLTLSLRARLSAQDLPGTWGFGFWNDPFNILMNTGSVPSRLPALPQAIWFFHASSQNYLSFRDDLPGSGFLAATFNSRKVPFPLLALASPVLLLALHPATAQPVRKLLRKAIRQDSATIQTDETGWHTYSLVWQADRSTLRVDGEEILATSIAPSGPLSLVIWVDNQYAALPPGGRLNYGTLPIPEPAWMEIRELSINEGT